VFSRSYTGGSVTTSLAGRRSKVKNQTKRGTQIGGLGDGLALVKQQLLKSQ
jgi:hypothetical protein